MCRITRLSASSLLLLLSLSAIVIVIFIFIIINNNKINIFTSQDIMKRFGPRPGFHIQIRDFYPDAEFRDFLGASYVSATDQVNNL